MRASSHRRVWVAAGFVATVLVGCHLIGDVEDLRIDKGGSGTGTGAGTGTGTASGVGPTCDPAACAATAEECEVASCSGGTCNIDLKGEGSPCGLAQDWFCRQDGSCVQCIPDSSFVCPDLLCVDDVCQAATCSDGLQNAGETGVDCGGGACPNACPNDQGCGVNADCVSGHCAPDQTCQPCQMHEQCALEKYCGPNNVCVPDKDIPEGCTVSAQCLSNCCCSGGCFWEGLCSNCL